MQISKRNTFLCILISTQMPGPKGNENIWLEGYGHRGGGGMNWEMGTDIREGPCVRRIASEKLCTEKAAQLGALWCPRGVEFGGWVVQDPLNIHTLRVGSLCCTAKTNITLQNNLCCLCSVIKLCPTLHPTECSTPGSSVLHYPPEFAQIHVH